MIDNPENGDGGDVAGTSYDRQVSLHHSMGGGKAVDILLWKQRHVSYSNAEVSTVGYQRLSADILLWKQRHVSFGIAVGATVFWILSEHSGLPLLTTCSDVLLILVVLCFLGANFAPFQDKQLQALPQLVLSEEFVNNVAASVRARINTALLMAHDIALGNDFKLFLRVVVCLWILSVIGSYISFFTFAYIGTIISITVPALYNKYDKHVDRYFGMISKQFRKHPGSLSKDKDE